ncbi:type ISP restriction/modification enzyme [Streptomyces sp. NPDC101116]|uniref:type ISP restriction/modification enzyme n=1 Tax=Streptomyces sp. NPDC101116 TaxID=3366107 RepID=UPI0038018DE3
MARIRATGEAVEETSYYGQMESLLNSVGQQLQTKVLCVLTTRNRGAGVPDGGLFISSRAVEQAGRQALAGRVPERGVMEVKGPGKDVLRIASTAQVGKYLKRYGKVLVTTYREFVLVGLDEDGAATMGEKFSLAPSEDAFWALCLAAREIPADRESQFEDYLKRVMLGDAPLSQPADLAWFLAAYAREGRRRLESVDDLTALSSLRSALEESLGLRFEGKEGEAFFRSALIQTLFYGVFAAWVVWSENEPVNSSNHFSWKLAQWTLKVPMVRVLFQHLTIPANLPIGLDEVLDWTEDALDRVDRGLFFRDFESGKAVQYFYEPFLEEYDPEMRKELGVWYTPPEVVRYMVARVHESLKSDLGLEKGIADENVHILDPCTGTGSFLVETIELVARALEEEHGDSLVAQEAKAAALKRVHGFELLPAPFVIAHLNVGLALERLGAPLGSNERAGIYLTNALTGWGAEEQPKLPIPEFQEERDAASGVKQNEPILVVIGNPPYNGLAGVKGQDENALVEPYRKGLNEKWDITKNKLNDLYVRFFRIAERRIAERTGKGIICYISNFSWLGDPSAVVMRQRLAGAFDKIYIDNLNGDSRETHKKTPEGLKDPSVFSTKLNSSGIQVGTAVSLLVRNESHDEKTVQVYYRDFWGVSKRSDLEASLSDASNAPEYAPLTPTKENWYRLRRWSARQGYEQWPALPDLARMDPMLGLNENRGEALVSMNRDELAERMHSFLDPDVGLADIGSRARALTQTWAGYNPQKVRDRLLADSPYDESRITRFCVKPLDIRWAYVDTTVGLWNRSRPELVEAAKLGSEFLLLRRRAPRALDGAAFLHSRRLIDQHVMHRHAYVIPFYIANEAARSAHQDENSIAMFDLPLVQPWRPNLSDLALEYLDQVGVGDVHESQASAQLIWQHALAIGYSPLYLEENADAIHNNWPRVPLPGSSDQLLRSAELGKRMAHLLDVESGISTSSLAVSSRTVGRIVRTEGGQIRPESGDLAVTAGWASEQKREYNSGAASRIVMPGQGNVVGRERTEAEVEALADGDIELLGDAVVDVFLNDHVYWSGVPQAVWDYKIGGFAVLRKWLSYRDKKILGRDLTVAEVREFTRICERLTEIVLLAPRLDENYIEVVESQ